MPVNQPSINYTSIKLNDNNILINSATAYRVSFIPPFNQIKIKFISDINLLKYEVRISDSNIPLGLDENEQSIILGANIIANQEIELTLPINNALFNKGDIDYRILLCAQSSVDGSWDLTQLFLTSEGLILKPTDYAGFAVPIADIESGGGV